MWGKQHEINAPVLSYWSIGENKTGGVAILLNPAIAGTAQPWEQERWTNRVIALEMEGVVVGNIYAPNIQADREKFYEELQAWNWAGKEVVLAGDFNCVLSPALDRLGGSRSGRPESANLVKLIQALGLEDARTLEDHAEEAVEDPEPVEFFTYWGPNCATMGTRGAEGLRQGASSAFGSPKGANALQEVDK
ncbi:Hypothetical protein PHPALM_7179 [Phytophthora palmivora]|uniref:Reverse transcriptase n=1 Tax=Phytophthora palmivora TaxID=4796 RepID=A0A2P4YCZ5_9STRA|nr:Hypothetical protein PHPALM_7179 [Phytophthora palmivora]